MEKVGFSYDSDLVMFLGGVAGVDDLGDELFTARVEFGKISEVGEIVGADGLAGFDFGD